MKGKTGMSGVGAAAGQGRTLVEGSRQPKASGVGTEDGAQTLVLSSRPFWSGRPAHPDPPPGVLGS